MRMKVLHIVWSGQIGGAETVLYDLLSEMSHSFKVDNHICFMTGTGPLIPLFQQLLITTHQFHFPNQHLFLYPKEIYRFRALLQREKYDVIHVHTSYLMAIISRLCSNSIILATNHGGSLINQKGSRLKQRIADRFIDHHIAVSKMIQDRMVSLLNIKPNKINLIYNGIPAAHHQTKSHQPSDNTITIGTIGRLIPLKKVDHFIHSASLIIKVVPHAKFIIIGDGPSRHELESLVTKLGLQSSIIFMGQVTNARALLPSFDLFCFTSTGDSFGMVVLEAMDANVPIVAYQSESIHEIIEHRVNGIIVKPTYSELAQGVLQLIQDPKLTQQMIKNAKDRVASKFTVTRMAEETLSLYQRLVNQ